MRRASPKLIRVRRRDRQYVIAFAIMMSVVFSGIAYAILTPPRADPFFSTWVLGSAGMAADYYPNGDPNLPAGEVLRWFLGVYNHMGSVQYVVIRVKLLNGAIAGPNETTHTPSPSQAIFEFRRVLLDNETWSLPFVWSILNLTQQGNTKVITRLMINNSTLTGNFPSSSSEYDFRFLFELWFYDEKAQDLVFSWKGEGRSRSAWTQIWFNATLPA